MTDKTIEEEDCRGKRMWDVTVTVVQVALKSCICLVTKEFLLTFYRKKYS